jgi:inner membrane protein
VEPFTHAFTSLALARAGGRRMPRFGATMMIVAGLAPDLDYVTYFFGPRTFLHLHRAALHSILGSIAIAFAVAAAFCAIDRKYPQKKKAFSQVIAPLGFGAALAVSAIGAAGHMLLDLASGIGVQLFWPFHTHWFGIGIIGDLDLWILLLLVCGLLLPLLFGLVSEEVGARKKGPRGRVAALVTLGFIVAYFGWRADLHGRAVDLLLSREYHGRVALSAAAFPASSMPYQWRGVVETDNTMELIDVALGPQDEFDSSRSVTLYKPQPTPALAAGEDSSTAREFLVYAKVPFARVQPHEAGFQVEIHDLRFEDGDQQPANIFVRMEYNSQVQLQRQGFFFASNPSP